ncbi:hypothetical protein Tco_0421475 [Tanacetum coccineum]
MIGYSSITLRSVASLNLVEESILPMLLKESLKSLGGLGLLSFGGKFFLRRIFEPLIREWSNVLSLLAVWIRSLLTHIENIGNNLGHDKEEDAHEFLRYVIDALQSVICMKRGVKPERHEMIMDLTVVDVVAKENGAKWKEKAPYVHYKTTHLVHLLHQQRCERLNSRVDLCRKLLRQSPEALFNRKEATNLAKKHAYSWSKSFARISEDMKNEDPDKEPPSLTKMFERTREKLEGHVYADRYDEIEMLIEQMKSYKAPEEDGGGEDGSASVDPFLAMMNKEYNGHRRLFDVELNRLVEMQKQIEDDHERKKLEIVEEHKTNKAELEDMRKEIEDQRDKLVEDAIEKLIQKLTPRVGRTGNSSKSEGKKGSSIEDIDEIEAALAQLKRESGL